MRKLFAVCSTFLLLSACNPFQPAPGTPDTEGEGEGFNEVMKKEDGEGEAMEKKVDAEAKVDVE